MGASFEVEAINSKENAFENKYQVVFTDLNSQMFLKYAIFAAFCFACFLSPAGRVVLKNLLPENQPGAEQELLQHVLWIENYSADRTNKANVKHVWNPHLSLGRWKWMYDCMTRVARGQANPSIASTSKRILKMHGTSLTLVQISEEQQRLLEQQQQQQLSRAKKCWYGDVDPN